MDGRYDSSANKQPSGTSYTEPLKLLFHSVPTEEYSPSITTNETSPIVIINLQEALETAYSIGPRVYKINALGDGKTPRVLLSGCQGSGKESQKAVAQLMNKTLVSHPELTPDCMIFAGDNVYDYGVNSADSADFQTLFHHIYGDEELAILKNIPAFLILGNHDANLHSKSRLSFNPPGEDTEIHQIAHHFLPDGKKYKTTAEIRHAFKNPTLDLQQLAQYNMPYFFYSLIAGDTQLFFLNSNSIGKDFLNYIGRVSSIKKNQIEWLREECIKAQLENRKIIFVQHHLPDTSGKRALSQNHDSHHYLNPSQIKELNRILELDTTSYNHLIKSIYHYLHLKPEIIVGAHDHFVCIDDSDDYLQLTCGGGGGDLQSRESFTRNLPVHIKDYGFSMLHGNEVDIHTLSGLHVKYDIKRHDFIRNINPDPQVEIVRAVLLTTCQHYMAKLKEKELQKNHPPKKPENNSFLSPFYSGISMITHYLKYDKVKIEEIAQVHEIMMFLNQPDLPDFETVVQSVVDKCNKLPPRHIDGSFAMLLHKSCSDALNIDLTTLLEAITPPRSPSPKK